MTDLNQPQDEDLYLPPRLTGAARRRFLWWLRQGKNPEESAELALIPFVEIPEYNEMKALKDAVKKKKQLKSVKFNPNLDTNFTPMGIQAKPPLSESQIKILKKYVLHRIRERGYEGRSPHFCGCYSRCNIFIMKCMDEHTIGLVTEVFPHLEPWEGAKLTLLNEREIKSEISMFFRRKQSKHLKTNPLVDNIDE